MAAHYARWLPQLEQQTGRFTQELSAHYATHPPTATDARHTPEKELEPPSESGSETDSIPASPQVHTPEHLTQDRELSKREKKVRLGAMDLDGLSIISVEGDNGRFSSPGGCLKWEPSRTSNHQRQPT